MLSLHPRKPGLCRDTATTIELLVRLDPDQLPPREDCQRAPLNLALVLDRSGSMQGQKMELTLVAASQAVNTLAPDDFVAVVIFDDVIETLYAGKAEDPAAICALFQRVAARNSTDLHGGWERGARELAEVTHPSRLSRVVVLTDGQTNHGVVQPETICHAVAHWARRSIQTTTLGFGESYNEELLRDMASSGHGNHGYIEDAQRLSAFFEEEMSSLLRTRGTQVRLRFKPAPGVRVEWLSEPVLDRDGQLCLADLVPGRALGVVVRLQVEGPVEGSLLAADLHWHDLESQQTRHQSLTLSLPTVDQETWQAMAGDPEVEAYLARAGAEQRRRTAIELLRMHQQDAALQCLGWALELPHLPEDERQALQDLVATVERGHHASFLKKAAMYSHGHGHGRSHSGHYVDDRPTLAARNQDRKALRLPLGDGPILHQRLDGPPPWPRVEGMLRGHFFGERLVRGNRSPLGEGATLSALTLRSLLQRPFDPTHLAEQFSEAPLLHPTTSQQKFRRQFEKGTCTLLEVGSVSAGCAALRRVCPFVALGRPNAYVEAVLSTLLTHRDNLALTASLGYLGLLQKLSHQPQVPRGDFYLHTFLQSIQGLEFGPPYQCQRGTFKGWQGHLKDFLPLAIGHARQSALNLAQASHDWGSGPYLLEVVPTVLYALELHASDPSRALQNVTTGTYEPDTLGMLVGAALGALHGPQPGWFLHEELEELLDQVRPK